MSETTLTEERRPGKKGGRFAPALCNILGTLILTAVIAGLLPVTVPRLLGYEIYNVVSGSMEPEIPVGSVVYVKAAEPAEIQAEDVIAFQRDGDTVTHRVVRNLRIEGTFVTKGDANAAEDLDEIPYAALIGRVEAHVPVLGNLMALYTSFLGKLYMLIFAACGAMLNLLAARMRDRD